MKATSDETATVIVRIPRSLHDQLKVRAVQDRTSMQGIVQDAIRAELAVRIKATSKVRKT